MAKHTVASHHIFQWGLLVLSIGIAFVLGRFSLTDAVGAYGIVGQYVAAFLVGALYSSVLTVAPATVGIVELAHAGIPLPVLSIVGGFGAMCADLTLFKIIKIGFMDALVERLMSREGVYGDLMRLRLFRYTVAVLGAVSIATPLPDELGLALMGVGRAHWGVVAIVGIFFNTLGIFVIASLAR